MSLPLSSIKTVPREWDIFCKVVDNYGDIGVCWRLARQICDEYAIKIRLWVDQLSALQRLCPEVDSMLSVQYIAGIELRQWQADFPVITPHPVVIESFACRLPESFIQAMASMTARPQKPLWINLDYLSAETWVEGCHQLPSPHPHYALPCYFFFPGFTSTTGGLLRERTLLMRCQNFGAPEKSALWQQLNIAPPAPDRLVINLFSYANTALGELLNAFSTGAQAITCLTPKTPAHAALEAFAGRRLNEGEHFTHGNLRVHIIPFVRQEDFDALLWAADINFVRGEDSFVRAQWAGKPFFWHIYPQEASTHLVKLDAFLDRYCANLDLPSAAIHRHSVVAWNTGQLTTTDWKNWLKRLPEQRTHAVYWRTQLAQQNDLCVNLCQFIKTTL